MDRLNSSLQAQLRDALAMLPTQVTLAVFTRGANHEGECPGCKDTQELVQELVSHSGGKVALRSYDVDHDSADADRYAIDKTPAIVVLGGPAGETDFGIRIFGAPDGYEFATLVEDVRMASLGEVDLMPATIDVLTRLTTPLHIQVFVTPTCPYCPRAALLAHRMAVASDKVVADVIDAAEFPELADQYHVRGVPRTVVNDIVHIEGAVPESAFLAQLLPLFEEVRGPSMVP
jgi:glutaredoxin-like protein